MAYDPRFKTGAIPTPRHKIAHAIDTGLLRVHRVAYAPPPQFAMVPARLSEWLNNQYGDCVSAEEAAAVAAYSTLCGSEYFIQDATVKAFCDKYGLLNGADLLDVIQKMEKDGFHQGNDQIEDGPSSVVDFSNETILQSGISQGPLKIGIDASALGSGAGNNMGWTAFGNKNAKSEDHAVSLFGYGSTQWLFEQLKAVYPDTAALPSNAPPNGYLLYTWKTIGIVDHDWIMGCTGEAYSRVPNTIINGKPLVPVPVLPPWWI